MSMPTNPRGPPSRSAELFFDLSQKLSEMKAASEAMAILVEESEPSSLCKQLNNFLQEFDDCMRRAVATSSELNGENNERDRELGKMRQMLKMERDQAKRITLASRNSPRNSVAKLQADMLAIRRRNSQLTEALERAVSPDSVQLSSDIEKLEAELAAARTEAEKAKATAANLAENHTLLQRVLEGRERELKTANYTAEMQKRCAAELRKQIITIEAERSEIQQQQTAQQESLSKAALNTFTAALFSPSPRSNKSSDDQAVARSNGNVTGVGFQIGVDGTPQTPPRGPKWNRLRTVVSASASLKSAVGRLQSRLSDQTDEKSALSNKAEVLTEQLTAMHEMHDEVKQSKELSVAKFNQKIEEKSAVITSLQSECEALSRECGDNQTEVKRLNDALKMVEAKAQKQIAKFRITETSLNEQLSILRKSEAVSRQRAEEATQRIEDIEAHHRQVSAVNDKKLLIARQGQLELQSQIPALENKLLESQAQCASQMSCISTLKRNLQNMTAKAIIERDEATDEATKRAKRAIANGAAIKARERTALASTADAKAQLVELKQRLEDTEGSLTTLKKRYEHDIAAKEKELRSLAQTFDDFRESAAKLSASANSEHDSAVQEIERIRKELEESRRKLHGVEVELALEHSTYMNDLHDAKASLAELQERLATSELNAKRLVQEKNELREQLAATKKSAALTLSKREKRMYDAQREASELVQQMKDRSESYANERREMAESHEMILRAANELHDSTELEFQEKLRLKTVQFEKQEKVLLAQVTELLEKLRAGESASQRREDMLRTSLDAERCSALEDLRRAHTQVLLKEETRHSRAEAQSRASIASLKATLASCEAQLVERENTKAATEAAAVAAAWETTREARKELLAEEAHHKSLRERAKLAHLVAIQALRFEISKANAQAAHAVAVAEKIKNEKVAMARQHAETSAAQNKKYFIAIEEKDRVVANLNAKLCHAQGLVNNLECDRIELTTARDAASTRIRELEVKSERAQSCTLENNLNFAGEPEKNCLTQQQQNELEVLPDELKDQEDSRDEFTSACNATNKKVKVLEAERTHPAARVHKKNMETGQIVRGSLGTALAVCSAAENDSAATPKVLDKTKARIIYVEGGTSAALEMRMGRFEHKMDSTSIQNPEEQKPSCSRHAAATETKAVSKSTNLREIEYVTSHWASQMHIVENTLQEAEKTHEKLANVLEIMSTHSHSTKNACQISIGCGDSSVLAPVEYSIGVQTGGCGRRKYISIGVQVEMRGFKRKTKLKSGQIAHKHESKTAYTISASQKLESMEQTSQDGNETIAECDNLHCINQYRVAAANSKGIIHRLRSRIDEQCDELSSLRAALINSQNRLLAEEHAKSTATAMALEEVTRKFACNSASLLLTNDKHTNKEQNRSMAHSTNALLEVAERALSPASEEQVKALTNGAWYQHTFEKELRGKLVNGGIDTTFTEFTVTNNSSWVIGALAERAEHALARVLESVEACTGVPDPEEPQYPRSREVGVLVADLYPVLAGQNSPRIRRRRLREQSNRKSIDVKRHRNLQPRSAVVSTLRSGLAELKDCLSLIKDAEANECSSAKDIDVVRSPFPKEELSHTKVNSQHSTGANKIKSTKLRKGVDIIAERDRQEKMMNDESVVSSIENIKGRRKRSRSLSWSSPQRIVDCQKEEQNAGCHQDDLCDKWELPLRRAAADVVAKKRDAEQLVKKSQAEQRKLRAALRSAMRNLDNSKSEAETLRRALKERRLENLTLQRLLEGGCV